MTFERFRELFPDALTIALLAGIESLLACVVADSMTGDRHNTNMERITQGIGNVASVFFGGFAATGAIARTATNVRAGANSSISAIVHSLFLVVVVMWLLPLTEYIPLAALAAVLVMVAYDMSDLRTVRHIFQGPKSDWSVMILTFALTVVFDLTVAVYTGVMLASLLFMRRMSELTGIHTSRFPMRKPCLTAWRFLPSSGRCSSGWPTGSSPRWMRWRRLPRCSSCTCTTRPPST